MDRHTPLEAAKHPRTPLAGPYGHPFHPILVTIPIGTWVASLIFDIIAGTSEDPTVFVTGAQALIAIGIIGGLLAAIFGLLDFVMIAAGTQAKKTAVTHMALNLGVVALFIINYFVRVGAEHDEVNVLGIVLSVIGLALLGMSGWLGGKLAYRYGVRVADEQTQAEGFR
ncbi:MAG TPA: DUF2231 domain-containing protein [Homoserinimonas sp.]|nr:DUF2231 domain-containing protein [Homoserinimonas sp.]